MGAKPSCARCSSRCCDCSIDDGVSFDLDTLEAGPIREDQQYGGVRLTTCATLERAEVKVQIDIRFGDAVTPAAQLEDFQALLDFPAPRRRTCPRETVVSER